MGKRQSGNKELLFSVTLKDCDVQAFQAGGKGGQHQNHSNTGVRVTHRASGAVGESREQRSQLMNKKAAFRRMTEHPRFRVWLNRELWARNGLPSPEEQVERDMEPEKIRVEVRRDGKWTREDPEGHDPAGDCGGGIS